MRVEINAQQFHRFEQPGSHRFERGRDVIGVSPAACSARYCFLVQIRLHYPSAAIRAVVTRSLYRGHAGRNGTAQVCDLQDPCRRCAETPAVECHQLRMIGGAFFDGHWVHRSCGQCSDRISGDQFAPHVRSSLRSFFWAES